MAHALEAVYVSLICIAWFSLLFCFGYRWGPLLAKQNPPVALPLVILGWSVVTIPSIVLWVQYKAVVGRVKTSSSWFVVGWTNDLNFFNIFIETWWEYTLLLMYNIGRTVLGSLVANVFRPLLVLQQSRLLTTEISESDAMKFVFAQAVVTVFAFFSAVTDIFLALTQIDVTAVALVVTLIIDGFATHSILSPRIRHGRGASGGVASGKHAVPVTASASAWRRTLPPLRNTRGDTRYRRLLEEGTANFEVVECVL
jgi:hypothetical protein